MLTDGLTYKGLENWTGVLQTQHPYRFGGRTCGFCASLLALGVIAVKLSGEWREARYSQAVIYQSQCQRCSLHKAHCISPHLECIDGIPEGQCPMKDLDELISSSRVDSRHLGNLS
jgi:hypothetical protein